MTVTESNKVIAPFDPGQVASLNQFQQAGVFHPFTCGSCRDRLGTTVEDAEGHAFRDDHLLVATLDGWFCPTCDFTQDWAWDFMATWEWWFVKQRMWNADG